jgi:protein-S-isoprenylcysteine O-methyltransferase Ste14
VVGFLIQWPTLVTLLMAPILIVRYVRLARQEDQELEFVFGEGYRVYRQRVPGIWPWGRRRAARLGEKVLQQ